VNGVILSPRERLVAVPYALATRELFIDTSAPPNVVLAASADNRIMANNQAATIGGGFDNNVATGSGSATIAGGYNNVILGPNSIATAVGGGEFNVVAADSRAATIAGGGATPSERTRATRPCRVGEAAL
jgi:hypothetical protein